MSGGDHRGGRSGPRHGRLFWRVYGHGLLLLVLVTLAVVAAAHSPWRRW